MKSLLLAATTLPAMILAGTDARSQVPQTFILDGIWGYHPRWEGLRSRIATEVGPCQIWTYNNSGLVSLETLGSELAVALRAAGGPVHLIGYSMGGLVVREALRQAPELSAGQVVLMHSPHRGSLNGHLLPLPACREMRPGSAFLRRLENAPWDRPTLVTWCPWDLMVFPGHSARWAKATHALRVDIPAHNWPIFSRSLHGTIVQFLREPAAVELAP
jgi:pimeloyl-ACP methyl ester carboxylesterase